MMEYPRLIIELNGSSGGLLDRPVNANSGSINFPNVLKYIFAECPSYPINCSISSAESTFFFMYIISSIALEVSMFLCRPYRLKITD